MNKIDMMSVWQGIEYKLVKQQEEQIKKTGMSDCELYRKIDNVREAMRTLNLRIYQKRVTENKAAINADLAKYGISI